jgi:hypothetical protein
MVRMTPQTFWAACVLAGDWRKGYLPDPINLLAEPHYPRVRKAVYVAVDRDGHVAYVGRVCRPGDLAAVGSRIREHVRTVAKEAVWAQLYVIPLANDTPPEAVALVEGLVGRRLQPYQSRRLPNVVHVVVS